MEAIERKFTAYLDEMKIVTILMPKSYHDGKSDSFSIEDQKESVKMEILSKIELESAYKYICQTSFEPSFGTIYYIVNDHGERTDLQIGAVIRTNEFDQKFYYEGTDLGVQYNKEESFFKLWAPTAAVVLLKLTAPQGPDSEIIQMKREDRGIWTAHFARDLEYWHYSFLVNVNQQWREAVDPYAVAVTPNGILGVIVDLNKVKINKPELPVLENPVDAVIYETHVRDLTIHPMSGVKNKGKYSGAAEINTLGSDGSLTGLSYMKDLGVTHIEFLPFHDFAGVNELDENGEYNWGYNPLHFNVPDGSYSTNPSDPYSRIKELKQMIGTIQQIGLRVITDVVYNHVYSREQSSFEKIVPGYFFRHDENGMPTNGTGVGNDIASERRMARKFIVDSVKFWMEEYHVDGFRFDLMGILDIETMQEVRRVVDEILPDGIIIGEGWELNTPLPYDHKAIIRNQGKLQRIGQFNDWFRDSVKGSTFNLYDKGYVFGNDHYYDAAKQLMAGSIGLDRSEHGRFSEPMQSVNYVESHDNHTLWDKLEACLPEKSVDEKIAIHRLATAMVIMAQGVPFIHSGQEFFRTKKGVGNSYRSPDDINQLDWERKKNYQFNVDYIKGLLKIRKKFQCFRYRTAEEIRNNFSLLSLSSPLIAFTLNHLEAEENDWKQFAVFINPTQLQMDTELPEGEWSVLANQHTSSTEPIHSFLSGKYSLAPVSLHVLAKKQ